jgi:putative FmdB family regulatory protein
VIPQIDAEIAEMVHFWMETNYFPELDCLYRRFAMPAYDFKCEKCKKKFTLHLTISEYEKTKFRCPKCKSVRVKQQLTPFQVVTSSKS